MGLGISTKEFFQNCIFESAIGFLLIGCNVVNYCGAKFILLNCFDSSLESERVIEEYNRFDLAKSVYFGAYLAAKKELNNSKLKN